MVTREFKIMIAFVAILAIVSIFQNCGGVNFSASHTLAMGTGTNSGNGTDSVPNGNNPNPGNTPPPVTDGSGGTDTGTGTNSETHLCYLAAGPGDSQRIGQGSTMVLDVSTAVPEDACMSSNACLTLINNYLNHTAGDLDGHYGPMAATPTQYTVVKDNGVCGNNPNVIILTDAQIATDLADLQAHSP